jgi:hypothetical protein
MSDESAAPFDFTRVCTRLAHCPVCGAPNQCRLETGEAYKGACWCERPTLCVAAMRRLRADLPEPRCLCPSCLETIAADPEVTWEELVVRSRATQFSPLRDGDFYSEAGRIVLTAQFHLRRGYCCCSGCRHCPFTGVQERDF